MNRRNFCAALLTSAFGARRLQADPTADAAAAGVAKEAEALMSLMSKTGGGKQFWADVWFFHDWRIQRHALTGHYRLLDGSNRRHASGACQACRDKLDEIRTRDKLAPMQGRAVIVLHGLFRTRSAMASLRAAIAESDEFNHVFCMGYPTTRGAVHDHAAALESVIRSLEGISEINFVAHSLGNLVVRHWLKDFTDAKGTLPDGQKFGRMVMLAPPNRQPQLATKLVRGAVATFVAGPAAEQMASRWESLEPKLATPHFEFGILAGGKGDGLGYNPLIPGDDDAVITVESTRLPGARDFRLLPILHSFFMNDKRAHELNTTIPLPRPFRIRRDQGSNRHLASHQPEAQARWHRDKSSFARRAGVWLQPHYTMRIAGIDYGTVRIGVALADTDVGIAGPFDDYTRRTTALDSEYFSQLAIDEHVSKFIVGLPVHLHGGESQKSTEARAFGQWLHEVTKVPVEFFDERFTTAEADDVLGAAKLTKKQRQARRDQLAAQIMLTAYLESGGSATDELQSID